MRHICLPLLLATSACATSTVARLREGEWRAVDVNGYPVTTDKAPTFRLEAENRVAGSTGCNSFSGTYRVGARERVRFEQLVQTEVACEPAAMEQERRYMAILASARSYSRYGDGSVSIIAADGSAIRFRR